MSVPKRSVLTCSRSFLAKTDVGYCSPKQDSNVRQNVSVVVNPSQLCHYNPYDENAVKKSDSEEEIKERSVDTADETLSNLQSIISDKDLLIQALVLCLDITQHNPLIINKYVIAQEDELALLIKYLTNADTVEIVKRDPECGCNISGNKYDTIERITVRKDGEMSNLKYDYPDVMQFLYDRKFSTKFVASK